MKKGENDPYIVLSIAKIFWKEKKLDKALKWYNIIILMYLIFIFIIINNKFKNKIIIQFIF